MDRITCLAASLALGLLALTPAAHAADDASLTITFKGLQAGAGAVLFTLVDSEAAYDGKAPAVTQDVLPASGGQIAKTYEGLAPGRYAIKAFHDVNGDGKMGLNPFGIPIEPFAFSNNAAGMMGPPKWAEAAFEVKAGANAHAIDID
jgi:uncharacterized protein (DUF2141 family)